MDHHNKSSLYISGNIFNIQHFSVHDGPGIRTVIFLKGCPLQCLWCSNPESQKYEPEIAYKQGQCISVKQCGLCISKCPQHAIQKNKSSGISIDRMKCDNCGKCAQVCPSNALVLLGKDYTVKDILDKVSEDDNFYWRSGGGPTLSGGEPFIQPEFVGNLLKELKKRGYHNVVETCGFFDMSALGMDLALNNIDLMLYDIKHIDDNKHKAHTGHSNERILSNLIKISNSYDDIDIIARTPVIPGFNDTDKDIQDIANFLRNVTNLKSYELLSYHSFGAPKYAQLGRKYALYNINPLKQDRLDELQGLALETLAMNQVDR
jgi:pyruvate formate lyase activating enzyme